jgi:2-polyprenyl-3-methyl-5-hydroxy-6-metoxy-1,4-benzoquinol methylase
MLTERLNATELMDDPALPPEEYARVLHDLAQVNAVTMAYRPTLAFLTRLTRGRRSLRLLDVGFGDGDMLRKIARWAQARDLAADLVGIDLNPNSIAAAEQRTPPAAPIRYYAGDYSDLAGKGFDCIISSLVAHHMTREELIRFLAFMEREGLRGWFVNDLHRHRLAYLGFPLLAQLMRWHPIVRADGQTSIARSFRPSEWPPLLAEAGAAGAAVKRVFPFRLCVERHR